MILEQIVEKRKIQLAAAKARLSEKEVQAKAGKITAPTRDFKAALSGDRLAVIAEVKKASPSKGLICPDFRPVEIAKAYEVAGADAISILTEEHYFQGSGAFLEAIRPAVSLPLLRKDFIIDPYQIYEARVMGADAILLIAALLDTETIVKYRTLAEGLGLHVLTEVHDEGELDSVLSADCGIIGINNRNLKTFDVTLETTKRLAERVPAGKILVSESGIGVNADMRFVKEHGGNAVLVGETLMRSESIIETLAELRKDV